MIAEFSLKRSQLKVLFDNRKIYLTVGLHVHVRGMKKKEVLLLFFYRMRTCAVCYLNFAPNYVFLSQNSLKIQPLLIHKSTIESYLSHLHKFELSKIA